MDFFNKEIFHVDTTLQVYNNKEKYRELTMKRLKELIRSGLIEETFEPKKYLQLFNKIHMLDGSFAVKVGVNFGLFGISVLKLGTEKHKHYIEKLVKGEILGAFAMTEVNHGSDVKNIQTTAHYNPEKNIFTIQSNGEQNRKCWIGNALNATHAVVFAQLIHEKNHGVHAFVVPLDNVKRFDLGDKIGLQGVDNGMLEFQNIEIPYDCLLDRFSSIQNGKFTSELNQEKRFGSMLTALTLGRVAISSGVIHFAKKSLYLALTYSQTRRQFSFDNKEESLIIEYPTVYLRLIPKLCSVLVYDKFMNHLVDIYTKNNEKTHKLSSGCKPVLTWFCLDTIQTCREVCGGNGYQMKNQFGMLKNDADIYTTFEGDNYVLLQQLGKIILTKYGKKMKNVSYYTKLVSQIRNETPIQSMDVKEILKAMKYKFLKSLLSVLTILYNMSKVEKNYNIIWNKNQKLIVDCCIYYTEYKITKISFDCDPNCHLVHRLQWVFDNRYYLQTNNMITNKKLKMFRTRYEQLILTIKNNLTSYLNLLEVEPYMISKM